MKPFMRIPIGRRSISMSGAGINAGTIRLWDVTTGAVLPDDRLASGSNDGTIRLWDVTTGAETARLEGHSGSISALCVLLDGRLASGSYDLRLCDHGR
jgi:WD40 repeat protein